MFDTLGTEEYLDSSIAIESITNKIENTNSEIDRALDLVDAMENLSIVVDRIGKLTPANEALVMIASEFAVSGSSIHPDDLIPSMESEDGEKKSFVENIKEKINKILKMIIEFFAKIKDLVTNFFKKAIILSDKQDEAISQLVIRSKKLDSKSKIVDPTKKEVSLQLIKPSNSDLLVFSYLTDLNKLSELVRNYEHNVDFYINKFIDLRTEQIQLKDAIIRGIEGDFSGVDKIKTIIKNNKKTTTSGLLNGLSIIYGTIPNNFLYIADINNEDRSSLINLSDLLSTIGVKIKLYDGVVEDKKYEIPKPDQLFKIIESLNSLNNLVVKANSNGLLNFFETSMEFTSKSLLEVKNALNNASSNFNRYIIGEDGGKQMVFIQKFGPELIRYLNKHSSTPAVYLSKNTNEIIQKLIRLCHQSLQAYGL